MLKIGEISSLNKNTRVARVKFDDMDNMVSAELKILDHLSVEYLKIGERVLCGFVENSEGDGYILGGA